MDPQFQSNRPTHNKTKDKPEKTKLLRKGKYLCTADQISKYIFNSTKAIKTGGQPLLLPLTK